MARYPLVGGPCDGTQSINFTVRPPAGYQVLCQTHLYSFGADGRFHDAGIDPVVGGVGTAVLGTHAPKGWSDLQQAVNHVLPTQLGRSRKLRRATFTTIARRRRVR